MTPQPWPRTGPGTARDGKPKFHLSKFDPAYFDRLRDYAIAAGNEGIYVSVMLFEGFGLHLSLAPDNVEGHPFHSVNNVNDIGIASINDYQVLPLNSRVQALQESYIREVIDTIHDLPGVLYEVANESSGSPSFASLEGARYAMGDTLRFAREMDLAEMEPRGDLSSTGYALANPGEEYLVLQPSETAEPFTVTLEANTDSVRWHSVGSRETKDAGTVKVEDGGNTIFEAPFAEAGPVVLHLKRDGR
jgi:hypothetical protein